MSLRGLDIPDDRNLSKHFPITQERAGDERYRHRMSYTHSAEPEVEAGPKEPHPVPLSGKWSRWPTFTALAIAAIAVALAITTWFRPAADNASPTFTDRQTAQAKSSICSAYTTAHQGVVRNTHLADPNPNDPAGQFAIAANARLALLGGGAYLHDRIAAEPAIPADLAQAVQSLADTIEQLGVAYLAASTPIVLDPLRHDLDLQVSRINKLCE